ncbi:hypothetical protein CYMTET_33770, partial [Cymbomonas tetramitiformis]
QAAQMGSATLTVMFGSESCGPALLANPYFFPPHHGEDMVEARLNRPASVRCDLEVPLLINSAMMKPVSYRVRMGERSTLNANYFRFVLPPGTYEATIMLHYTVGGGADVNGDLYLMRGNLPVQLDLEDYYMWHYQYKVHFKGSDGVLAKIVLNSADVFGRDGEWYVALDWNKQSFKHGLSIHLNHKQAAGYVPDHQAKTPAESC